MRLVFRCWSPRTARDLVAEFVEACELGVKAMKVIGIVAVLIGLAYIAVDLGVRQGRREQHQAKSVTVTFDGQRTICTQDQQYDQQSVAEMMGMISDLSRRIDATDARIEAAMNRQRFTHKQWSEQYR